MPDNVSFNGGWKPQTGFADRIVDDVKQKLGSDEEIVIPLATESMQQADKKKNEVDVEYGLDEVKNYFKTNIDSDGDGKLSTMKELQDLSEYSRKPQAENKSFTAKAKAYIDNLYNTAQIDSTAENSPKALKAKYKNEVNSKNIAEIENLIETLSSDAVTNAQSIHYLTNLRDAYWMKHAAMDDNPKRMIAEMNKNDLSGIKVGK